MKEMRLCKAIALSGICSRRKADEMISDGRVKVNGQYITELGTKIDPSKDIIIVDEARKVQLEPKRSYLFHKPKGVICSCSKVGNKKIILDYFSRTPLRLFSIGRLDKETSGLLLVTNDGDLAQKIIHPSANIIKEYEVKVEGEVKLTHLEILRKGAYFDKRLIRPVFVKKIKYNVFTMGIKEGKKHEVRIITHKAKLSISTLKRTRIGSLSLGRLPIGSYRDMTQEDVQKIFTELR